MKPLLVGESNPYGGDPFYALYPAPDGCSGHRLACLILGMRRKDYLDAFDRVNLVVGNWSIRQARLKVAELRSRYAVLMGAKVCAAYDVPFEPFSAQYPSTPDGGGGILVLPHPSGRNLLWNQAGVMQKARAAVAAFCPDVAHLLGIDPAP